MKLRPVRNSAFGDLDRRKATAKDIMALHALNIIDKNNLDVYQLARNVFKHLRPHGIILPNQNSTEFLRSIFTRKRFLRVYLEQARTVMDITLRVFAEDRFRLQAEFQIIDGFLIRLINEAVQELTVCMERITDHIVDDTVWATNLWEMFQKALCLAAEREIPPSDAMMFPALNVNLHVAPDKAQTIAEWLGQRFPDYRFLTPSPQSINNPRSKSKRSKSRKRSRGNGWSSTNQNQGRAASNQRGRGRTRSANQRRGGYNQSMSRPQNTTNQPAAPQPSAPAPHHSAKRAASGGAPPRSSISNLKDQAQDLLAPTGMKWDDSFCVFVALKGQCNPPRGRACPKKDLCMVCEQGVHAISQCPGMEQYPGYR